MFKELFEKRMVGDKEMYFVPAAKLQMKDFSGVYKTTENEKKLWRLIQLAAEAKVQNFCFTLTPPAGRRTYTDLWKEAKQFVTGSELCDEIQFGAIMGCAVLRLAQRPGWSLTTAWSAIANGGELSFENPGCCMIRSYTGKLLIVGRNIKSMPCVFTAVHNSSKVTHPDFPAYDSRALIVAK